jgi:hypothetical protein
MKATLWRIHARTRQFQSLLCHSWGLTHESPQQLGPSIITDFVEGTLASRILQKPTDDDEEELIMTPDLDGSLLDKFLPPGRQTPAPVISIRLSTYRCHFNRARDRCLVL